MHPSPPPEPSDIRWHALPASAAVQRLATHADLGLSHADVAARQSRFGPNRLPAPPRRPAWLRLLQQFHNVLIYVMLVAALVTAALGHWIDTGVLLGAVIVNAIIGFLQEGKAESALDAIRRMLSPQATVLRGGERQLVAAEQLVPGDIVLLASGDKVPADLRILECRSLLADEAALTGESLPSDKGEDAVAPDAALGDRHSMLYAGTLVAAGTAVGAVVATGTHSELGRIGALLAQVQSGTTPLLRQVAQFSRWLALVIVFFVLATFAIGVLWRGQAPADMFMMAVALAAAAIPESLPALMTITLAMGVRRLAQHNAIIRHLPAVETLGSVTVICSDKTGTLTCNEMTVTELWTPQSAARVSGIGYAPEGEFSVNGARVDHLPEPLGELVAAAALCNDAALNRENGEWTITGDPTEAALLVASAKAGQNLDALKAERPRLDAIPFASEHQYMATLHGGPERTVLLKGAPEVVVGRCQLADEAEHQRIIDAMHQLGERGMRVLAVASRPFDGATDDLTEAEVAGGCTFLGLIGMIDPPRTEAVKAIAACHRAGIVVKMITGDHRTTALAIGRDLNLAGEGGAVTGVELATMDDERLVATTRTTNIFARVAPEHKLRLVKALQGENHVVAMTGDGVNDAPSLKQSNIGVAMGITGTAVSQESADIVLADDNFASISAAVEEGRRVYDNLIKSLAFLLPTNLGLALILIYGIMFFPFDPVSKVLLLPMLPTQLLWINLVAAVALALPLAFEVKEPDIMDRPPRQPDAPLFNTFVVFRVVLVSILMTAGTIVLFTMAYNQALADGVREALALSRAQTIAVTFVIFFQVFYMIHCRSLKDSLSKIGFFSNPTVFWGIAVILGLQALFIYLPIMQRIFRTTPLGLEDLAVTALAGLAIVPVISIEKWVRLRLDARRT